MTKRALHRLRGKGIIPYWLSSGQKRAGQQWSMGPLLQYMRQLSATT